ncbi:hypothetical protein C0J08_02990 [Marinomonas sp. CT5]|uniref:divergent polysaccharide deacetylase family protein n=1 Tax=Marinomonas sp. CT5 TaxID=2066133 RepID=UPI001BAF3489|nr:divergent polysaccharide deacetylase family protein [Marinomonas sp. CT5]QUX94439.1 hypothetical protein C0J08_02990 [Marinomonas sp. CT5]
MFSGGVGATGSRLDDEYISLKSSDIDEAQNLLDESYFSVSEVLPEHLGPVLVNPKNDVSQSGERIQAPYNSPLFERVKPWEPSIAPFLEVPIGSDSLNDVLQKQHQAIEKDKLPAKRLAVDVHPKMPRIAILIDDLGYNRHGMESSLLLPKEVALAILPSTPFAIQTAKAAQKQKRITLLHAPMENQRELKLGPGGLYARMTEHELKATLNKDLDGLPGIQGVNNHMGSLLTTRADSMKWVMETLKDRSLFFIDSLTSPKSVAKKTAQDFGLDTVSRDVFLDNIRTEKAIDRQFSRLLKLARLHGSALAIGHPYPETMAYLKKRLQRLTPDGVELVPLSDVLIASPYKSSN